MMGIQSQIPLRRSMSSCSTMALMVLLTLLEFAASAAVASNLSQAEPIPPSWVSPDDRLEDANKALANCKNYVELFKSPVCAPSEFSAAIQDVMAAQLLFSSERRRGARKKATAARKRNANCLETAASIENPLIRKELLSMMLDVDNALEDVEKILLPRPTSPLNAFSSGFNDHFHHDEDLSSVLMIERDMNKWSSWGFTSVPRQEQGEQQEKMDLSRALDWDPRAHFAFARDEIFSNVPEKNFPPASVDLQGLGELEGSCSGMQADGTVCQLSGCGQGKNLVWCAVGFARGVLGGYNGIQYVVTSDHDQADNPPYGTLRHGLNLARSIPGGVWIIFSRDMTINLRAMLWVHSHTTVDGRNYNIAIRQHRVAVTEAKHVILENLHINSVPGGDTVHIFGYCSKVWVDHVTSYGGDLGLVSVVQGSTDVTISNCKLSNPNFNMLLGASDQDSQDQNMRVSVYRNHFFDSWQRMPHCRWGWCHVANNLYQNWGYYAIGARVNAKVKAEYNVFVPNRVREVTPWHPAATSSNFDFSARIESKGDILVNDATFHQFLSASHDVRPPYSNGEYPPLISADRVWNLVANCAGARTSGTMYSCWRAVG